MSEADAARLCVCTWFVLSTKFFFVLAWALRKMVNMPLNCGRHPQPYLRRELWRPLPKIYFFWRHAARSFKLISEPSSNLFRPGVRRAPAPTLLEQVPVGFSLTVHF
ncbi:MAG TPA: hypothetical protein VIH87_00115 [Methylocella sp.]